MIRNVLYKLGSLRSALAVGVGVPILMAGSAFAQTATPTPSDVTNTAPVDPAANANRGGGEATTERVVVTGSYIPTSETESALPVTVYTAAVLQKQGANTPTEGLRQLPSFVGNAATENDSNAGNGQANINLRALGPQNVLTLINGRRAFEYSDINAIPIGGLSRTEVLKDGASAIYGSDAVAGVVNFIMLNGPGEAPYEGAEIFGLYGNTTETDEHVLQGYIRGGVATDKVSVAAAAEYYSKANLYSADRAKLAGTGNVSNFGFAEINPPTGILPLGRGGFNGNSQTFAGRVSVAGRGQLVLTDLGNNAPTPASYRPFALGTDPVSFNFRAFTPTRPAIEKAMYYITGRYKIFGEGLQVYGDVMYSKTKQDNGLAPSPLTIPLGGYNVTNNGVVVPLFGGGGNVTGTSTVQQRAVIQNSPFNPFPGRNGTTAAGSLQTLRYRLVNELGPRRTFFDKDNYRYVTGLNGDFNFKDNGFISHFGYDAGVVYERFDQLATDSGDARRSALYREIIAGNFNPFIGQNAPAVGVAPTYDAAGVQTGTRPYDNIAAAQRAAFIGHSLFRERDWLGDAKINAHLMPNLYNGGFDIATGYEHREIATHSDPDPVEVAGDPLGFNGAPGTKFLQKVDSVFAELTFPIVTSTMNVPFVRSLELSAAWRYEKFNDKDQYTHQTASFKNNNQDEDFGGSPRVSLRYQPIADLTLRANWNQSFLAPSPSQLFSPVAQNFPNLFDPYYPVGQGSFTQPTNGVFQGGNFTLQPEKTDSYSVGFVYTPKWLPGFTVTVDGYDIFTTDVILPAADAAQLLLTLNTPDPDGPGGPAAGAPANGVTRNPDGSLASVDSTTANAGKRHVQGMDVTAVYEIPTQHLGTFTFSGGWNHFFVWKAEPVPGFGYHNFLGDYSSSFPLAPGGVPFNRAFARFEWAKKIGPGNMDFVATGNYVGDYEDDPQAILGFGGIDQNEVLDAAGNNVGGRANPAFVLHHRVSDYETLDMQLSYEFTKPEIQAAAAGYSKDAKDAKSAMSSVAGADTSSIWQRMLWNTTVTVGVNNVFDRYPPTVLGAFNDNYDTSNYNIRNRYYYVSLRKKF